jgi:hypothetical protein
VRKLGAAKPRGFDRGCEAEAPMLLGGTTPAGRRCSFPPDPVAAAADTSSISATAIVAINPFNPFHTIARLCKEAKPALLRPQWSAAALLVNLRSVASRVVTDLLTAAPESCSAVSCRVRYVAWLAM